jgi:hypothetical protein
VIKGAAEPLLPTRGENTRKAVTAFREMRGLGSGEQIDERLWRALADNAQEPALVTYTITEKDVAGPFIEKVPKDYREKASLKRLSYTSAQELLAEKFHMSEKLLWQLNSNAAFDRAGTAHDTPSGARYIPHGPAECCLAGAVWYDSLLRLRLQRLPPPPDACAG